jgi:DNA-binding response OmpR family regulator
MSSQAPTALIASSRPQWRHRCAAQLLDHGCDVHTASSGFKGLDLLRKHIYEIIVVDDSFSDISPLEFCLTAQDLAANRPIMLVAGDELSKLEPFLNRRDVYLCGPLVEIADRLPQAVKAASQLRHRRHVEPTQSR